MPDFMPMLSARIIQLFTAAVLLYVGRQSFAAPEVTSATLMNSLHEIAAQASGTVSLCLIHVESGTSHSINGENLQPLYSVVKFPVCVAVLAKVAAGDLQLDQQVTVSGGEIAPGIASNVDRWKPEPKTVTVRDLLSYALIDSDNTANDKLMQLAGGPSEIAAFLVESGYSGFEIKNTVGEIMKRPDHPNRAGADEVARLLADLQRGNVLPGRERHLLFSLMRKSKTGQKRLRAGLPADADALDKTGTGPGNIAVNDVGMVRLPDGDHLVIAVLISGASHAREQQEAFIANIAREAYHYFAHR